MPRCGKNRGVLLGILFATVTWCVYNSYDYFFKIQERDSEQWNQNSQGRYFNHDSRTTTTGHGYILTLHYTGQQIAGVRGILSQQCLASSFKLPLKIVEPFVVESNLIHSASLWTTVSSRHIPVFSDYYDMSYYNEQSEREDQPPIVKWNSFLTNAPRNIILLNIENIFQKDCLNYKFKTACEGTRRLTSDSHFTSECDTSQNIKEAVAYLTQHGFKVVREVCLNCKNGRPPFKPEDIIKYIYGKWRVSDVVLLTNQWRFSIQMAPNCTLHDPCETLSSQLNRIQPSSRFLGDTKEYIRTAKRGETVTTVVGIMVRIEWFLIMYKNKTLTTIKNCLSELVDQLRKLAKPDKPVSPVVTLDVGKFGSGTFNVTLSIHKLKVEYFEQIVSEMRHFVEEVHKPNKVSFEDWEQTYVDVNGSEDRGYIAALQSTIASEVDCLIQMGGGHYQQVALIQYLHNHPSKDEQCIYSICTPQPWKNKAAKLFS